MAAARCSAREKRPWNIHFSTNCPVEQSRNTSDYSPGVNRLYFGDNLGWLQNAKEFRDASVDLVYLDPPFNSNADYNVLFRETSGEASQAQFRLYRHLELGRRSRDLPSIHRHLPERRGG